MENKKIIIITIILFLVGGMGTFVFASNPGNFDEEDINYSKDPTYQKVDTPTIDTTPRPTDPIGQPTEPDSDDSSILDSETNNNDGNGNAFNNGSSTSNKKPADQNPNSGSTDNQGNQNPDTPTIPSEEKPPILTPPSIDDSEPNNKPNEPSSSDKKPPVLSIAYSTKNPTNQNVIVTITANEPIRNISGWTISSNQLSLSKRFTTNETKEISIYDIAGNETKITYKIENIDKTTPNAIVTTSNNNGNKQTFRDIIVTIMADEDIKEVDGWELKNKRELTKTFGRDSFELDENGNLIITEIKDKVTITDLAGNINVIDYEVKNYNPNFPEVIIGKKEDKDGNTITTITEIFDKPLADDGSWVLDSNGDYVKVEEIENRDDSPIIITLPDGNTMIYETNFKIDVSISNKNGDVITPTNKAFVTINSNKELQLPEYCTSLGHENACELTNDNKTLIITITSSTTLKENIYDVAGNYIYLEQTISKVNSSLPAPSIAPIISSTGKVTIYTNNEIDINKLANNWHPVGTIRVKQIYKIYTEEEIANNKEETITLTDIYGNTSKIKIKVQKINGKNKVTYEMVI